MNLAKKFRDKLMEITDKNQIKLLVRIKNYLDKMKDIKVHN
ncbi:hypothetical protein [Anaerococcus hydrogenalis]|nr:hypothetical protein [Anaerococcus hydrogenalis]